MTVAWKSVAAGIACLVPFVAAPASAAAAPRGCGPSVHAVDLIRQELPTDPATIEARKVTMDAISADFRALIAEDILMNSWEPDRRGVLVILYYPPCPTSRLPDVYRSAVQSYFDARYGVGAVVVEPYAQPIPVDR